MAFDSAPSQHAGGGIRIYRCFHSFKPFQGHGAKREALGVTAGTGAAVGKGAGGLGISRGAPRRRGPHFCPCSYHLRCRRWVYQLVGAGVSALRFLARSSVAVPATLSHVSLWADRKRAEKQLITPLPPEWGEHSANHPPHRPPEPSGSCLRG